MEILVLRENLRISGRGEAFDSRLCPNPAGDKNTDISLVVLKDEIVADSVSCLNIFFLIVSLLLKIMGFSRASINFLLFLIFRDFFEIFIQKAKKFF